jgi:LEA14-like dessication related protein
MKQLIIVLFSSLVILTSCVPREDIVLRDIKNLVVEKGNGEETILGAEAVFYNPNAARMKLKEIKVDVMVDGKKSATVDQKLKAIAKGKSEFTVPLKVKLEMKDIGLVDALKSLLGGKKYEIHYKGYLKVNINGLPFRVPVDHKEEFRLKF